MRHRSIPFHNRCTFSYAFAAQRRELPRRAGVVNREAERRSANYLGESKTEAGLEIGTTRSLQFHRAFPDTEFAMNNFSVSGFNIHPLAHPPSRTQSFVNKLKQIALIGIALFFEKGIRCKTGGILIVGRQPRHPVLEAGNRNVTKGVGYRISANHHRRPQRWLVVTKHRQNLHLFLSEHRSRGHRQQENQQKTDILWHGQEAQQSGIFGSWHARLPATGIPNQNFIKSADF